VQNGPRQIGLNHFANVVLRQRGIAPLRGPSGCNLFFVGHAEPDHCIRKFFAMPLALGRSYAKLFGCQVAFGVQHQAERQPWIPWNLNDAATGNP
jgi:hypothetical protein